MGDPFELVSSSYSLIKKWISLDAKIIVGFTTRNGGISKGIFSGNNLGLHVGDRDEHVIQNRTILADQLNFPLNRWVFAEQIHNDYVHFVTEKDRGAGVIKYTASIRHCDGLYTNTAGTMLALCFADCVPVYFFAPEEKMIGIVHAGWRGTVKNIIRSLIDAWRKRDIRPEKIFAAIGPSICNQCFIVDNKVIDQVCKLPIADAGRFFTRVEKGQYALDLKGLNKELLLNEGLPEENILISNYCTSCDNNFFSHRREKGQTGRMIGFIGIEEA